MCFTEPVSPPVRPSDVAAIQSARSAVVSTAPSGKTEDPMPGTWRAIRLPNGWRGQVLVRVGTSPAQGLAAAWPDWTDWQRFLSQLVVAPHEIPDYAVLKCSRSADVIRGTVTCGSGWRPVVCKHTWKIQKWTRLLRACRSGGLHRQRTRAEALLRSGINTAQPLAMIKSRAAGETWLATAFIPGLVDLDEVALARLSQLEVSRQRQVKSALLATIVDLCARLEANGLYHRDLKASNILLADWAGRDGPVRLYLVDLDGVLRRPRWRALWGWRPLVRLAASLADHASIARTDYARFLKAYLAISDTQGEDWKPRFRSLSRRVDKYVRRARVRKADKLDGFEPA